jgi:hypothetical protein
MEREAGLRSVGHLTAPIFPFVVLQQRLYFAELDCWIPYTTLPRYTESRIEQLCTEAKTARTEGDAKGAVKELQATLAEHIGLARQSLEAQVSTLASLEAKNKYLEAKVKKSKVRRSPRG